MLCLLHLKFTNAHVSYTVQERASVIYKTATEVFDYTRNCDLVTPIEVVRKQIKGVSKTSTVCVPGAGIGTYVLALIEGGIDPQNITAVEVNEGFYLLGKAMFGRFGVNYVHANFLTWEPQMKFDAIVGNPPYTDTSSVKGQKLGGCAKGLDNLFFEKCMELAPYVSLIIRSKHFSKAGSKFRKKLFENGHMREIKALSPEVFPSISLTETCIATFDSNYCGETTITYQGGLSREVSLSVDTCVKLTNPDYSAKVVNNLGCRYERGTLNLNKLQKGDYPIIVTMGAKGEDMVLEYVPKEQAICGANQHGVVMNSKYGGKGFGKVCIKPYAYPISGSAIMLKTSSEEESKRLQEYLLSDEVQALVVMNKISNANTKELFSTISDPLK